MKKLIKYSGIILLSLILGLVGRVLPAQAMPFTPISFELESISQSVLDYDDECDDCNTGNTDLGFNVSIGGATFDSFDMNSNGYVQLLSGSQSPVDEGYGNLEGDLIDEDDTATYLLAAYDDLSSDDYGYYGYSLESDRAIFYYDTETYDNEDDELLNNFQMILGSDGSVQWNFNTAEYDDYGYDLFSGLYFGESGTTHELYREFIPEGESWLYAAETTSVPEPSIMLLLGSGLLGLATCHRKARKKYATQKNS